MWLLQMKCLNYNEKVLHMVYKIVAVDEMKYISFV